MYLDQNAENLERKVVYILGQVVCGCDHESYGSPGPEGKAEVPPLVSLY